ncbi:sensor domain-containing protein [Mycobacterium riyadhense]|uniref:sensor domain-containing protein n=1 Tax=Mycobacterium riyadhense TaxID=486698 RepID=UPI00195E5BC8|nr:sensor domain-containing protein [Mycobacterium riyadhense]
MARETRCCAGLLVVLLATGCTAAIAGNPRPAPGLTPRPVAGETIKQVLLDDATLSKILNQPFKADSHLPPRFGGPEKLQTGFGVITPVECAGVSTMTVRSAYASADVKNVARESWWNAGGPAKVISVAEAVVALPTAADADALFAKFSEEWEGCNGKTATVEGSGLNFEDQVTDVRVANSVLAATVFVHLSGTPSGKRPEARAIGVRVNCLVEVEVTFFSTQSPSDQGSGDPNTSAIDIAHVMMDRITALS